MKTLKITGYGFFGAGLDKAMPAIDAFKIQRHREDAQRKGEDTFAKITATCLDLSSSRCLKPKNCCNICLPKASDPISSDPLLALVGSGKHIWADEHADEYVRRLREGWE